MGTQASTDQSKDEVLDKMEVKEQEKGLKLNEIEDSVRRAFYKRFDELYASPDVYICGVWEDHIITKTYDDSGEKYLRYDYTASEAGVSFGEPQLVEQVFVPKEAMMEPAKAAEDADTSGPTEEEKAIAFAAGIPGEVLEAYKAAALSPGELTKVGEDEGHWYYKGYIYLWGDPDNRDMEGVFTDRKNSDGSLGEYFTKDTEFDSSYVKSGVMMIDWEHGRQELEKSDVLGYIPTGSMLDNEYGKMALHAISRHNTYSDIIKQILDMHIATTSSEPVQGRTAKSADGRIEKWPLRRNSVTVTPMEPRMKDHPLVPVDEAKAVAEQSPMLKAVLTRSGYLGEQKGSDDLSEGDAGASRSEEVEPEVPEVEDEKAPEMADSLKRLNIVATAAAARLRIKLKEE